VAGGAETFRYSAGRYPNGGNGNLPAPRVAADLLIFIGAVMLAASLPLIALRFLSLKPGLFPFLLVGTIGCAFLLRNPRWIVPSYIGLVWTSIDAVYFGGLPSPIETAGLVLLGFAVYQATLRFDYAKEVLVVSAFLILPLLAAGLVSPNGMELPVPQIKNVVFLFIAAMIVRSVADVDRSAITLACVGIFLGIGSMFSVFVHPTPLFPLKAPDIQFIEIAPRAAGPVGDPNFFALVMAALVPFGMYLIARGARRQMLGVASVLVVLGGVFATGSRGGMLAAGAGIVGAGLIMPVWRIRVAAAAVVIGTIIALPVFATQTQDANARSVEGRLTENLVAIAMFSDYPATGVGPGLFPDHYRDYSRNIGNDPRTEREAHSLPLEIAAEQGLAGIIGTVLAFLVVFRFALARGVWNLLIGRTVMLSIACYMIASLFLHGSEIRLLWLLLGILLGLGWAAKENPPRTLLG
jgi:O-antigen ligase